MKNKKMLSAMVGFGLLSQFAFAQQPQKKVLIEEGTGTWCQWCPRGTVYGKQITQNYEDDAVFIAIHSGDDMENTTYSSNSGLTGLPSGNIDRASVSNMSPSLIPSDLAPYTSLVPLADIDITTTYDPVSRALDMTVSADFASAVSGDWRLAAIVVEDGITGPAPTYNQSNAYSGGGNGVMGGYENLPSSVSASIMVYNHVGRYLAGGYNGDSGSLPSSILAGQTHSYTYNWTLPTDYNEDYISVVGVLVNATTGQVSNVNKSDFIMGYSNASPFYHSTPQELAYSGQNYSYDVLVHDPEYDNLIISSIGSLPGWMTLTDNGDGKAVLSGIPTTAGTYPITLNVYDGIWNVEQTFVVTVEDVAEDWTQVGSAGFSQSGVNTIDFELSSTGTPYVLTTESSNIKLYEFTSGAWQQVGGAITGNTSQIDFALDPSNTPFIFSDGIVQKYNGTSWEQVGNTMNSDGIYPAITFDNSGNPFVVYWIGGGDTYAYHLSGSSWVSTGNGAFTDAEGVWVRAKQDESGAPIVIYGTDAGNIAYSEIARYDGSNWTTLGGHIASGQTYFDHDFTVTSTGDIYAALTLGFSAQEINIYKYNGTSWDLHSENVSGGATGNCRIEVDNNDDLILAFRDENQGGKTSVMKYDGSNWSHLGLPGFTPIANDHALQVSSDGVPYVAYADASVSEKVSVKKYDELELSTVDFNMNQIRLFPNPNHGIFTVDAENNSKYGIYSIDGKLIETGELQQISNHSSYQVSVPHLEKGMYIFSLIGSKHSSSVKFIIE